MVNTLMERSAPCRDSDLRHQQPAGLGRKGLGWDAEFGGSEGDQNLFTPSGIAANSRLPSFPSLEGLDLLSKSLETLSSKKTRVSYEEEEEAIPEVPQEEGRPFHVVLPPPPPPPPSPSPPLHLGPEILVASSSETFCLRDVLVPFSSAESPNPLLLDQSSHEDTQALFWASICRVQQCLLELQGEMDRKEDPSAFSSQAPEEATPMDWANSCEPSQLANDSEEEEKEEEGSRRQEEEPASWEEEEEEEEEMEYLFYNNPLFQESSRPARAEGGFESLALFNPPEGEAPGYGKEEPSGSDMDANPLCQRSMPGYPMGTRLPPLPESSPGETPCSFPCYVPHCRSWSPLMITEGDPDEPGSLVVGRETQSCLPEQQLRSPIKSIPEDLVPGADCGLDLPAQGLLLSLSRTSLASSWLLQKPPELGSPCKPPLPPTKARRGLPVTAAIQTLPDPAGSEQNPGPERLRGQTPRLGCHGPSCAWAAQASGTSSQQKEVAGSELSSSIHGAGRKPGGSAESSERMAFPGVPGQVEETLDQKEEEEVTTSQEGIPEEGNLISKVPVLLSVALEAKDPDGLEGGALCANGLPGDQAAALRLATRLYYLDGFQRSQVAAFLQKNNEFSQKVAEAYLSFFEFKGKTLDQALRSFLQVFVLTGETQERERILQHFSQRYHGCNPQAFRSPGAVHTLTCALMLLHTDLHGQNIGRSMSCQAFVANLEGLNDGQNFPKELLKALYYSIRHEKLGWAVDEAEAEAQQGQSSAPSSIGSFSSQKKSNPFLSLVHDPGAQTYRKGLLARKVLAEADGKKTPWGKRGWKIFHMVLKGMVMYFFKEESRMDSMGTEEPLGVHHALAERASKYTKRPHVFRLQTADWRVFLFQAPSAEEMSSWISRINLVAAMFSSPPFPAAVGSQRKFIRPIFPTAPSKNPLEEQYEAHESCLDKASDDLLELQRNLPDRRGSRGRDLEEYRLRKEYLLYEKRRYETYVRLLEVKLSSGSNSPGKEELDQWEARLGAAEAADQSSVGLQKSHSSPSLNAEGPTPTTTIVKVKRNISERRTVRKIIPKRNKHLL